VATHPGIGLIAPGMMGRGIAATVIEALDGDQTGAPQIVNRPKAEALGDEP
jgi:hypothetical protein